MRNLIIFTLFASTVSAQTPNPPAARVCHRFDWNAGYEVPVTCKASKPHPKLAKVEHSLKLTAETVGTVVVAGGLLYLTALSPSGVQVH